MQICCWGSRGQIPVSGPQFTKYGGDTTCIEVRSGNDDILIIDAGSGIRNLGAILLNEKKRKINLLFTHLHLDHIVGLPFFTPLYNSESHIHIYGCSFGDTSFQAALNGMMRPPYFPVDLKEVSSKISYSEIGDRPFWVGSIKISPVLLNHPNGGLGFKLEENGVVFVFLTDNELGAEVAGSRPFSHYVKFCRGADLLVHDAEFKPEEYPGYKSWGHSTYSDAVRLAIEAEVKRLGLFHINNQRSDEQVDALVKEAKMLIAEGKENAECFALASGFSIQL